MRDVKPVPEEQVGADVNLETRVITEDEIDELIEFSVKSGKNRLVVRILPREYLFSI